MSRDLTEPDRRAVLVVDDCAEDFDTVVEAATRGRVPNRLVHAADAESARGLLGADRAGSYAFMLLDYKLPGIDGLAFLRQLRRDPHGAWLPTVIYSTSVNPSDRDAFYAAGANAYHVKRVRYGECLRTLEGIFGYWLNCAALPAGTAAASLAPRPT